MIRFGWLGLLLLGACGPQAEPTGQAEPSAPAADSGTAGTASLPDYLPDYPNSRRVEVPNLGAPGTDSRSGNAVAMETDDTPEEVAQFYRERLAAAGVPVRVDSVGPQGGVMGVGRDGERGAMLTISRIGDRTRIAVISRQGG